MKDLAFVVSHKLRNNGKLYLSNGKALSLLVRELSAFYNITLILRHIRGKKYEDLPDGVSVIYDDTHLSAGHSAAASCTLNQLRSWRTAPVLPGNWDCVLAWDGYSPWCIAAALWRVAAQQKTVYLSSSPELYLLPRDLPAFKELFLLFNHVICADAKTQASLNLLFSQQVPSSLLRPVPDYEYYFSMLRQKAENPFDGNKLNIISSERIFHEYGVGKIPELARNVKEEFPQLNWFLLGSGNARDELLRDIVVKDLCETVFPYTDVSSFYDMIYYANGVVCFEDENSTAMQAARVFGVPTFIIHNSSAASSLAEQFRQWLSTLAKYAPENSPHYSWPDLEKWKMLLSGDNNGFSYKTPASLQSL